MITEQHELYEYARERIGQKKTTLFSFYYFYHRKFIFVCSQYMDQNWRTNTMVHLGNNNLAFYFYFAFY